MNITINNETIKLKQKMRAMIIYEQLSNKPFNPQTITDLMLYFYSIILANKPDVELTFAEFMDYLDDNPNLFTEFNEWLLKQSEVQAQFNDKPSKKK